MNQSNGTIIETKGLSKSYDAVEAQNRSISPSPGTRSSGSWDPTALALHLLPGLPILLFYLLTEPYVSSLGFPPDFALLLAVPLVLVPTQLGYLLYRGKQRNGRLSLDGIVLYREHVPGRQFGLLVGLLLLWNILVFLLLATPTEVYLKQTLFSWLPTRLLIPTELALYHQSHLLLYWLASLLFGGIVAPVVEELYFRGYLLPRLAHLKTWSPIVHTMLFAIYHFWSPWQFVTRVIGLLPLICIVRRKKSIYVSMVAHCMLNTIFTLGMLPVIFGAT